MDFIETLERAQKMCKKRNTCEGCILGFKDSLCGNFTLSDFNLEKLEKAFKELEPSKEKKTDDYMKVYEALNIIKETCKKNDCKRCMFYSQTYAKCGIMNSYPCNWEVTEPFNVVRIIM